MDLYFYTPEQRRMDRGKIVVKALQSLGGEGTAEHLLEEISSKIGHPAEVIETEIKKVLNQAIRDGFLIKKGRTYVFPGEENAEQMDSRMDAKRKRDRSRSGSRKQTPRKRVRLTRITSPSNTKLKPKSKPRTRSRSRS